MTANETSLPCSLLRHVDLLQVGAISVGEAGVGSAEIYIESVPLDIYRFAGTSSILREVT